MQGSRSRISFKRRCRDLPVSEAEFAQASGAEATFDADTGRLSDTITWYAFGAQGQRQLMGDKKSVRQGGRPFADPEIDAC